ncbi:MAG: hypothetical protein HYS24_13855 [Ignavibacteriales bacterium]|nr:hypothetical protein [Ignavibacteriales bacterium]
MRYRIKNIKTNNFVTVPLSLESANRLFENLYKDSKLYKIVPFEIDIDKLSSDLIPMDDDVKSAIKLLKNNTLIYSENQQSVAATLIDRYDQMKFVISEKENIVLWAIIYKNKLIVEDLKLLSIAHQYFFY